MFPKAKVKRFNEEGSCAPAPNAYDAKLLKSKSGPALVKSQRFEDAKYVTPGPGEYCVPGLVGARKVSGIPLARSASFRIKKGSIADLTNCGSTSISSLDGSKTPRKLRRSSSSTNLTIAKPKKGQEEIEKELEVLAARNRKLESEVALLRSKLSNKVDENGEDSDDSVISFKLPAVVPAHQEDDEEEKGVSERTEAGKEESGVIERLETLEAELHICREELRLRTRQNEELVEERESLRTRCEELELQGDMAHTLRREVVLLAQDNQTLEEQLDSLRKGREEAEEELARMLVARKQLEARCEEEDAKKIFLHFTQEQLNTQVVSLEQVVGSLRQENHLLNRGMAKLVTSLQEERHKYTEVTEAYSSENADSEVEFTRLQSELDTARAGMETLRTESREVVTDLRKQVVEAQTEVKSLRETVEKAEANLSVVRGQKDEAEAAVARLESDLEVSENDKAAVREDHAQLEAQRNGLALDLAEVSKGKSALESELGRVRETLEGKEKQLEKVEGEVERMRKEVEEARSELSEIEMSKMGLEGEVASLHEEMNQLEVANCETRDLLEEKERKVAALEANLLEQGEVFQVSKEVVEKLERQVELQGLRQEELSSQLEEAGNKNDELFREKESLEIAHKILSDKTVQMDTSLKTLRRDLASAQVELTEVNTNLGNLEKEKADLQARLTDQLAQKTSAIEAGQRELEAEREVTSQREAELGELHKRLEDMRIGREEVEESLLDTQELVACMENKLEEAYSQHREEAERLVVQVKSLQSEVGEVREERLSLVQMNTELSTQVSESLHAIASLQNREKELGEEVASYQVQLECLQEEGERERSALIMAEDDILSLQAELESAVNQLGETEADRHQLARHQENLVAQLDNIKTAYNSAVQELNESKTVGRELLDRLNEVEREQEVKEAEARRWEQEAFDKEAEVLLLRENVKHLEGLRDNLELNVNDKIGLLAELKAEMDMVRGRLDNSATEMENVKKANCRLKGNLEVRMEEIKAARRECEELQKQTELLKEREVEARQECGRVKEELEARLREVEDNLTTRTERVRELETDRGEIERIRMKEMEIIMELRADLDNRKKQMEEVQQVVDEAESAKRSMEAQQRLLCEAEARTADAEGAVEKWREKLAEAEEVMLAMEERLAQAEEQNQQLKDMIEPFKDQLESFEVEKNALLSQSQQAQGEIKKLAEQYGSLLGHQNQRQKIHHVVKIKQENVELKSEMAKLQEQLAKSKKTVSRLEERLNEAMGLKKFDPRLSFQPTRNKENFSFQTPQQTPRRRETSLDRTKSSIRLDSSDRSPLRANNRK